MTANSATRKFDARRLAARVAPFAVIVSIVLGLCGTGAVRGLDNKLAELRFSLIQRSASDTLAIVEIDAPSLQRIQGWPWSRGVYADTVQELTDAGANLIAFDVDFSAVSDPAGDARFGAAISRAGGRVALPTFVQAAQHRGREETFIASPADPFAADALFANVNIIADPDGVVRKAQYGADILDDYRPSISSMLAGAEFGKRGAFGIDFGVNLDSIPRLSIADVRAGTYDAELVRGRNILIGATALELGDEFVTPRHKLVSGVLVHALAYESLVQGRALSATSEPVAVLIAVLVIALMTQLAGRWSWTRLAVAHALCLAFLIGAPLVAQATAPILVMLAPAFVAQALCLVYNLGREIVLRHKEIVAQRAAKARYQTLVGLAVQDNHDGVIVTDADGRIEVCNAQAREFLGAAENIAGGLLSELAPQFPLYGAVAKARRKASGRKPDGGPLRYRTHVRTSMGRRVLEVTASCAAQADESGEAGGVYFIYTLHDATARVRFERAEAAAKQAALDAADERARFIRMMSAELSAPMTAIHGFANAVTQETYGSIGSLQYKSLAADAAARTKRLKGIIAEVAELAELDHGEAQARRAASSVADLLRKAMESHVETAADRGLKLNVHTPECLGDLFVDFAKIRRLIDELVANAVRAVPDGGAVDVTVRCDGGADAVLEVRNDADLIPPARLAQLVEPFVQGRSGGVEHHGTGLGLHLVKRFAELHGGALELESTLERGFVARVRLPGAVIENDLAPGAAA